MFARLRLLPLLTALACGGGTTTTPDGATTDHTTPTESSNCEIVPDKVCGELATGDTGCPEGFSCSGPSGFECYRGNCELPTCLPPGARIATPSGDRALADLRVGDLVWTRDATGARVAAPVEKLGSKVAPPGHELARVTLSDGRVLAASPNHPTADDRPIGSLRRGDLLDGATVVAAERAPFPAPRTYDLRPAGATGEYWADGVLVGTTLP